MTVVFSKEDRILINKLCELKVNGANRLIKEFPTKAGNYERWTNCWQKWKTTERLTATRK